jgi:hypothetical protein
MRRVKRLFSFLRELAHGVRNSERNSLQNGKILTLISNSRQSNDLQDFEFSIFSQWGEDGILQKLIDVTPIANKTFIEFGVENFLESNCRFLLMQNNWSGFVIDGSEKNTKQIANSTFYWKYDLRAFRGFISSSNINELLSESCFDEDLGILSIDIDGVDYWVFKALESHRPRILVLEYNAVFGSERAITVPDKPDFVRTNSHYSNLYFGASLRALVDLADEKGYTFVGTNTSGLNAFFIRKDVLTDQTRNFAASAKFTNSLFRESRSNSGDLTYLRGSSRHEEIQDLIVFNTHTSKSERL